MQVIVPPNYRNLIDRVNIFQLIGDAKEAQSTMEENCKRITTFYERAVPELPSVDLKKLPNLLEHFYRTANYYHVQERFAGFIVPTFDVIFNNEWLTVTQFIDYLRLQSHNPRLDTSAIKRLLKASCAIRQLYYPKHEHSIVLKNEFKHIIIKDFYELEEADKN